MAGQMVTASYVVPLFPMEVGFLFQLFPSWVKNTDFAMLPIIYPGVYGARVVAAIIQVQADLRGIVSSCWPGHIAENVFASRRGDYVFLQNISDAVVWFKNAELAPYGTAIYKKNGDALELVYNQTAFTWSPLK